MDSKYCDNCAAEGKHTFAIIRDFMDEIVDTGCFCEECLQGFEDEGYDIEYI